MREQFNRKEWDSAIKHTSGKDKLIVMWWCIVNPNRVKRFNDWIGKGMHFKYAMKRSKYGLNQSPIDKKK